MKSFSQLLRICVMASSAVYGLAILSDNPLPIDAAAEEAGMALVRRQVDTAYQTNWSWVLREETRTYWDLNNNVNVLIDAQTTEFDGRVIVQITNRSQRYGNAVILTRYAADTNTGPIQDQIRIEVGLAVGRTAAFTRRCIRLPSLQGSWWWQLEN
ncbi:hypothetical protein DDE82_008711 [Stemphylium lycopersici]|nr:hypothetical protein DDE82_008711 [Stemphylium lycopersici]